MGSAVLAGTDLATGYLDSLKYRCVPNLKLSRLLADSPRHWTHAARGPHPAAAGQAPPVENCVQLLNRPSPDENSTSSFPLSPQPTPWHLTFPFCRHHRGPAQEQPASRRPPPLPFFIFVCPFFCFYPILQFRLPFPFRREPVLYPLLFVSVLGLARPFPHRDPPQQRHRRRPTSRAPSTSYPHPPFPVARRRPPSTVTTRTRTALLAPALRTGRRWIRRRSRRPL